MNPTWNMGGCHSRRLPGSPTPRKDSPLQRHPRGTASLVEQSIQEAMVVLLSAESVMSGIALSERLICGMFGVTYIPAHAFIKAIRTTGSHTHRTLNVTTAMGRRQGLYKYFGIVMKAKKL